MDEDVASAVVRLDETKALSGIEPLDRAARHSPDLTTIESCAGKNAVARTPILAVRASYVAGEKPLDQPHRDISAQSAYWSAPSTTLPDAGTSGLEQHLCLLWIGRRERSCLSRGGGRRRDPDRPAGPDAGLWRRQGGPDGRGRRRGAGGRR